MPEVNGDWLGVGLAKQLDCVSVRALLAEAYSKASACDLTLIMYGVGAADVDCADTGWSIEGCVGSGGHARRAILYLDARDVSVGVVSIGRTGLKNRCMGYRLDLGRAGNVPGLQGALQYIWARFSMA